MTKENDLVFKITIAAGFIGLIFFIQQISNYKRLEKNIVYNNNNIRSSYGDEFYNYKVEPGNRKKPPDNTNEIVIEGFNQFNNIDEAIRITHSICPVTGDTTSKTTCIHLPNNNVQGLPGPIDGGFFTSVKSCDEISTIQDSLNNNNGLFSLIYENDSYILQKNGVNKQLLLQCNPTNLRAITSITNTTLGNC
jgi:hypothetical protein